MKMMQGADFFPWMKRSRTRAAPTPTNISTKSEPLMEKNGTPASPAIARARSVFPVPGAPTRSTPLGIRPPSFVNRFGSLRNAMISCSSSLASSIPATSAKVTLFVVSVSSFARLLPNDIALPPPACIWRMKKIHTPISRSIGSHETSMVMYHGLSSSGRAVICTFLARRFFTRSGSSGA